MIAAPIDSSANATSRAVSPHRANDEGVLPLPQTGNHGNGLPSPNNTVSGLSWVSKSPLNLCHDAANEVTIVEEHDAPARTDHSLGDVAAQQRDKKSTVHWLNQLTKREDQVLQLIAKGFSNQEISDELHIATATTKVHIRNIFEKLHVNSRTKAIVVATREGLL